MKKKNLLKKGIVFALALSMILPSDAMTAMASDLASTEAVETPAEETVTAETPASEEAPAESQTMEVPASEEQVPVEAEVTAPVVEENVTEANETVNTSSEYYEDEQGNRYNSWDDIPCETNYIYFYTDEDGNACYEADYKWHAGTYIFTDEDGYEVDLDDLSIPCDLFYHAHFECENCDYTEDFDAVTGHIFYDMTYTGEDGTEYDDFDSIPCGTTYVQGGVCERCGETVADTFEKEHSAEVEVYTAEDGTVYDSFEDIPCEATYTVSGTCINCGEDFERTEVKEHTYYSIMFIAEDGNTYASWDDIPCQTHYTLSGTCMYCGEEIGGEDSYKTHFSSNYTYIDEDGNVYEAYEDIPCNTNYTESYTCDSCGEEFTMEGNKPHDTEFSDVYFLGEDGTEYSSYGEIPCGTRYTESYTCASCGAEIVNDLVRGHSNYNEETEELNGIVYELEDGTEIDGNEIFTTDDLPDCQIIKLTSVCAYCGQAYFTIIDTHNWEEDENGDWVCSTCGISEDDLFDYSQLLYEQTVGVSAKEGETVLLEAYSLYYYTKYQWQYSTDGGVTWADCEDGLSTPTYSFTMDSSYNGRLYRCILTLDERTETTENMSVVLESAITIISQPEDQTAIVGNSFSFAVEADGEGLTYLWQYSTDGGETWTNTTRTKNNYGTKATNALNGRMFRCVITDKEGNVVITDPATLTVKPAISITSQPSSVTVNAGEKYSIKVSAKSNTGSKLTYLWQYSKTLKGWTDTTRTINNYGTYATVGVDGKYFRCKITDEAGNVVYSEPAMVRVLSDITITAQPTDTTVANGKRYYFTVTATGANLTYKWEYSKDGGNTWIETTRTKNNYTTYAKKAMNGWMFRCVITDSSNNTVTSEAGTLTVK